MFVYDLMKTDWESRVPHVEAIELNIIRLIAKFKTLAAFAYKKAIGQPYIYPQNNLFINW